MPTAHSRFRCNRAGAVSRFSVHALKLPARIGCLHSGDGAPTLGKSEISPVDATTRPQFCRPKQGRFLGDRSPDPIASANCLIPEFQALASNCMQELTFD